MQPIDSRIVIRLGVLTLAREIRSVSKACRQAGISRSTFYKIKRAYEVSGYLALQPALRRKPKMPNAFSDAVVERVLEETRRFPSYSYNRISERLCAQGLKISGSGVRKIWERRKLGRKADRRRWIAQSPMSTPPGLGIALECGFLRNEPRFGPKRSSCRSRFRSSRYCR